MTEASYRLDSSERDTAREMSPLELREWYEALRCPFCHSPSVGFRLGPMGGMQQNVECPQCECRLSIVASKYSALFLYSYGLALPIGFGQLIRNPRPGCTFN